MDQGYRRAQTRLPPPLTEDAADATTTFRTRTPGASLAGMPDQMLIVGRVALAAVLGYVVGWERELRGHDAGDRTFALVALGAGGFVAVIDVLFPFSASRVIQGVAAGVGFLGLGMIFRSERPRDVDVRGLTTAAAIWVAAALGTLAGMGAPLAALASTAIVVLILELEFIPRARRLHELATRRRTDDSDDEPAP
jgi:putative Mg2+ transporter-C (MgtC) family protein